MLIAFSPATDATMKTSTDTRRLVACKAIKMTTALIALIEAKLTAKWSPEQVYGWLREDRSIDIIPISNDL